MQLYKKALAALLCVILLILAIAPLAYAEEVLESENTEVTQDSESDTADSEQTDSDQEEQTDSNLLEDHLLNYTCEYDRELQKIQISGVVNHDVMITHKDYTIELYRLDPSETIDSFFSKEDIKPSASTKIASKFQFSIDASTTVNRFSKYVVLLKSPAGEIFVTEPRLATIDIDYKYSSSYSAFKGIQSLNPVLASGVDAGTAIVPVYMERLLSTTGHGYIYPINSTYRYFDEAYVSEIDKQVRTYSASGTKVYLQLLLTDYTMAYQKSPTASASFYMPDVYDADVTAQISAFVEFLSDRYVDYTSGQIAGLILGTKVDQAKMNDRKDLGTDDYSRRYAYYLYVISASARVVDSDLDIVVPISDLNDYQGTVERTSLSQNDVLPSVLLEKISAYLEEHLSKQVPFNLLVETTGLPLSLDAATAPAEQENAVSTNITADNVSVLLGYLDSLRKTYQNVPQHVMLSWSFAKQLDGTTLARGYVYSYTRLLQNERISSFIINFTHEPNTGANLFLELERILAEIDTNRALDAIGYLESAFDEGQWQQILKTISIQTKPNRTIYTANPIKTDLLASAGWKGSFSYFDFENGNLGDFQPGIGCTDIKSSYTADGVRTMDVQMQHTSRFIAEELLCLYEYPEDFSHTNFLKVDLSFHENDTSKHSIYEVVVTLGDSSGSLRYEYLVQENLRTELWLDLSEYNREHVVKYIRIDTRELSGAEESYSFSVYEITGYSEELTDEELSEQIGQDRLNIRNEDDSESGQTSTYRSTLIVFGILLGVMASFFGMYFLIRRSMEKQRALYDDDESSEDSSGTQ